MTLQDIREALQVDMYKIWNQKVCEDLEPLGWKSQRYIGWNRFLP